MIKRHPHLKSKIDAALHRLSTGELAKKFEVRSNVHGIELWEDSQLVDSTAEFFFEMPTLAAKQVHTAVVGGFGLGAWLQFLLKNLGSVNTVKRWLLIEPSIDRFLFSLQQTDFSQILSNQTIEWQIGLHPNDFFEADFHYLSNRSLLLDAKPYAIFRQPIINAMHHGYFDLWQKQWDACLELAKNTHSFFEDGYEGFKNTIENRRWIAKTPGLNLLRDKFQGIPAIVVSTGPSLKRSLPLLKELQNKALLLAADASLKILVKENIFPHFVFCLERDEGSKPFFEGLDPAVCRSHLMSFPLVPQSVIGAYKGPHWTLYRNYEYYSFLETENPRGLIKCGPSVAHMAMNVAAIFGCSMIHLVGQDLSFDPESLASHPEGISYTEWSHSQSLDALKEKLAKANDQLIYVPGNLHKQVPTSGTYEIFRQVFADNLNLFSTPVVNCTDGGAQIPGVPWKSLQTASQDFVEHDFWKIIAEARATFKPQKDIELSSLANALRHYIHQGQATSDILQHFLGREQIEFEWKRRQAPVDRHSEIDKEWRSRSVLIANKLLELLV